MWGFKMPKLNFDNYILKALLPLFLLIFDVILHELTHGIFFGMYASKGLKFIKFGLHCKTVLILPLQKTLQN
jgi:hypothetical protein